jgi:hypothetical protein
MNGLQMYNGRPITYKNKPFGDQLLDYGKHIVGQYSPVPAPVMSGVNFIDTMVRNESKRRQSKTIEPRTTEQSLLQMLGINTMTYDEPALRREQRGK